MHKLPSDIIALFDAGQWPVGFISVGRIPEVAPFLVGYSIELVDTMENILNGSGGVYGPLRPSFGNRRDPVVWRNEKMGRGSAGSVADLPWIDVDMALTFGGGAIGDELAIVLDYRTGGTTPRVVANKLVEGGSLEFDWVELAPSFSHFWELLDRP